MNIKRSMERPKTEASYMWFELNVGPISTRSQLKTAQL